MSRPRMPFDDELSQDALAERDFETGDQKQQIEADDKIVNVFHSHLDECAQCREHPFALCDTGRKLIVEAATEIKGDPFA